MLKEALVCTDFDQKQASELLRLLFPSRPILSQIFSLGGKLFYLSARCLLRNEQHYLGVFVHKVHASNSLNVGCELAVMNKSSMEYQINRDWVGENEFVGLTWTDFMSDDSDYIINDVLRLRTQITLNDFYTYA
ncbi:hypothetical protein V2J09_001400 [Rumex salicifolius]